MMSVLESHCCLPLPGSCRGSCPSIPFGPGVDRHFRIHSCVVARIPSPIRADATRPTSNEIDGILPKPEGAP